MGERTQPIVRDVFSLSCIWEIIDYIWKIILSHTDLFLFGTMFSLIPYWSRNTSEGCLGNLCKTQRFYPYSEDWECIKPRFLSESVFLIIINW